MQLMSVPESKISEMRAELMAKHTGRADWVMARVSSHKRDRQRIWCETYARTASISAANQAAEVTWHAFSRWRSTDPDFCEMYNQVVDHIKSELQSSVLSRAIGERPYDQNGNPAVDADGKPIYRNGSDRLAVALLGLEKDKNDSHIGGVVTIEIVSPSERKGNTIEGNWKEEIEALGQH